MINKPLLYAFFYLILFFQTSYAQRLPTIGTGIFKPELCDQSFRLYFTDKLETAHLISREGRYLHTWSYPQGVSWRYAEMLPDGILRVLLENKQVIELDWQSRFVKNRRFITAFNFVRKSKRLAQPMPNGNVMITDWQNGRMAEMTPKGKLAWEYLNPDLDANGKRMTTNRIVPVDPNMAAALLRSYGLPPDLSSSERRRMHLTFGTQLQLSETLTAVIALIEARYWDEAFRTIRLILQKYPNHPEALYTLSLLYAQRRDFPKAIQAMDKSVKQGLPLSRFQLTDPDLGDPLLQSEPYKYYLSQNEVHILAHGPMLDGLSDDYVDISLKTTDSAVIAIKVRKKGDDRIVAQTASYPMESNQQFSRTFHLSGLFPETRYVYEIWLNGRKLEQEYAFHTYPKRWKAAHFQLGFGGETPFLPSKEGVWDTLARKQLSAFLLLGNSMFLDFTHRPATLNYGYDRRFCSPEFNRFVSGTSLYTIAGDRDFGYTTKVKPTDSLRQSPYYTLPIGDTDFFMLDNWSFRDTTQATRSMLGSKQKQWLLKQLENSTSSFKVIASSVPWTANDDPEAWSSFKTERDEIFDFIRDNNIKGVLLISGGRRRSDAWRIPRDNSYALYEFTSAHLSHPIPDPLLPDALLAYNKTNAYGLLEFDTTQPDPVVTFRIMTLDDKEIHRVSLYKSQLE